MDTVTVAIDVFASMWSQGGCRCGDADRRGVGRRGRLADVQLGDPVQRGHQFTHRHSQPLARRGARYRRADEVKIYRVRTRGEDTVSDSGVGMPQHALLNLWGTLVMDAFGEDAQPYLVGSATKSKQWRDVDIRVMLDEGEWGRILPGVPYSGYAGAAYPRWAALCMAVSAWGREFTGLPIDFQFQPTADANARFDGLREPLGMRISK
jgi:hypothetical protein